MKKAYNPKKANSVALQMAEDALDDQAGSLTLILIPTLVLTLILPLPLTIRINLRPPHTVKSSKRCFRTLNGETRNRTSRIAFSSGPQPQTLTLTHNSKRVPNPRCELNQGLAQFLNMNLVRLGRKVADNPQLVPQLVQALPQTTGGDPEGMMIPPTPNP